MPTLPILPRMRAFVVWATIAAICAASATEARADEEMQATARSGRVFSGRLDDRTNDRELWLRSDRDGVTIARPIEWSAVTALKRGAAAVAHEELIAEARRLREARPQPQRHVVRQAIEFSPDAAVTTPQVAKAGELQTWRPVAHFVEVSQRPTVRWIEIDGYLANWDADVEADGLLLDLNAYDESGEAVAAGGTLSVELIGETVPPYSRGNAAPMLARWTRQVSAADFARGYARLRFEFQAVHPDFQRVNGRFALIHARLLVPGQGTFEASRDAVALQGFSPVRERVEQAFGTRFLPTETTGRGHRESGINLP